MEMEKRGGCMEIWDHDNMVGTRGCMVCTFDSPPYLGTLRVHFDYKTTRASAPLLAEARGASQQVTGRRFSTMAKIMGLGKAFLTC